MCFVHVLDPSSTNFDLLVTIWTFCTSICINLVCILILVWFYFVLELIKCYFRLTSSVEAILCQDRPQTEFSSLHKSRATSVRGNIGNKFTLYSHFLYPLEFYVVYNWNYIIFSAQMDLREQKKKWCPFFFFEPPAATNQLGSGLAFWCQNPLAGLSSSFLEWESPTISVGMCCRCQGPQILLLQGKK